MNAIRHGLLAKCVLLKNESPELFQALAEQYIAKLLPNDDVELACVEEAIAATWRLRRTMAIETNLLNRAIEKNTGESGLQAIASAFEQLSTGSSLHLIDRYESRLNRLLQRSLSNLALLRQLEHDADPDDPAPQELPPESPVCHDENCDEPGAAADPLAASEVPAETQHAPAAPDENPVRPNEPRSGQPYLKSEVCNASETEIPAPIRAGFTREEPPVS